MNGDIEPKLDAIDAAQLARREAEQRLSTSIGQIAVDIELIANEEAIEAIKQDNPDVDFSDETQEDDTPQPDVRERLKQRVDEAINAKKDSVLADYQARKARERLLNED